MDTLSKKIKPADVFTAFNMLLFFMMCIIVYYERFILYRGPGNIHEFFLYALLIAVGIFWGWKRFRHLPFPVHLLVLIQFGILAHFAGGFIPIDGGRLYDAILFNVRVDKIVHFLNAFAGAALANHVFNVLGVRIPMIRGFVIIFAVLGFGAVIEIVEYLVMLTVPNTGVGGYHNNMMDLVANFLGCGFFVLARSVNFAMARLKKVTTEKVGT